MNRWFDLPIFITTYYHFNVSLPWCTSAPHLSGQEADTKKGSRKIRPKHNKATHWTKQKFSLGFVLCVRKSCSVVGGRAAFAECWNRNEIYMLISHLSASSGNTETTVQTGWARPVPTDDWLTRARIARHSSSFLRNNAAIISRTRISCRRFDGCRSNFPLLFARFISVYAPPKVCWTIRDDGFGCAKIARCARARVCVPSGPTNPCTRMTNKKSTKQNGKKTSRKKQKYVERRTRPLARQITLIYVRESAPFRKSVK